MPFDWMNTVSGLVCVFTNTALLGPHSARFSFFAQMLDEIGRGQDTVAYKARRKKTFQFVCIRSAVKACKVLISILSAKPDVSLSFGRVHR